MINETANILYFIKYYFLIKTSFDLVFYYILLCIIHLHKTNVIWYYLLQVSLDIWYTKFIYN